MSESEITWHNCADKMPPNTEDKFIFKDEWGYWYMCVCKGKDYITGYSPQDRVSYTPYTPEKWEELKMIEIEGLPEGWKSVL